MVGLTAVSKESLKVVTNAAPKAIGPYSHAIKAGNTIYISRTDCTRSSDGQSGWRRFLRASATGFRKPASGASGSGDRFHPRGESDGQQTSTTSPRSTRFTQRFSAITYRRGRPWASRSFHAAPRSKSIWLPWS